jgi:hypothetical protein
VKIEYHVESFTREEMNDCTPQTRGIEWYCLPKAIWESIVANAPRVTFPVSVEIDGRPVMAHVAKGCSRAKVLLNCEEVHDWTSNSYGVAVPNSGLGALTRWWAERLIRVNPGKVFTW